jgi:positive regulator of sigma E activity
MIGRGTDNHIELPNLVYIAFFFVGIAVSIMLGFLDAWVFFIIFFGLILTFVILWIRGQSQGGE